MKSAQFPVHGWLPEVMETPTPVSALLHAGIINAGGFLVIRMADVVLLSGSALHLLAIVGGFTALLGALVALTQTSVKLSLAWSTISQMGFMLLQCGLGLFPLALLHIVAHSLYKAHAFLASGSVVDLSRSLKGAAAPRAPAPTLVLAVALSAFIVTVIGALFGYGLGTAPQALGLGAVAAMGVTLLVASGLSGQPADRVLGGTLAAAAGVGLAYFALATAVIALYTPALPAAPALDGAARAILLLAVVSFAGVALLQLVRPWTRGGAFWTAARVHLANGLYAGILFDRLVAPIRRLLAPTLTPATKA
jgi:NAD(P)H-quinone oxidoreductase subunit 5